MADVLVRERFDAFVQEQQKQVAWRERETLRQATRTLPVWVNEGFWLRHVASYDSHFVHISQTDPALLAYTQNEEKGQRDIQTPIKPGKYLKTFCGNILTEAQIKFYAEWQIRRGDRPEPPKLPELKLAWTEEEIFSVYKHGPSSCMDGSAFPKFETSLVRAYGAGDIAVAYLEGEKPPPHHKKRAPITARCVVWPEKKVMARNCYGDPTLFDILRREGYKSGYENKGGFTGARLLMIPCPDFGSYSGMRRYLIPSLEFSPFRRKVKDGFFVFDEDGGYSGPWGPL